MAACAAGKVAAGSNWLTATGSAMRVAAVMAWRSASAGRLESGKGVNTGDAGAWVCMSIQQKCGPGSEAVRCHHRVNTCIASRLRRGVYIGEIIAGLAKNESLYFVNSKEEFTNE